MKYKLRDTIAANIRRGRLQLHKTQSQIGKQLNWPQSRVSKLERGEIEPSAIDLYEIAKLYNKPLWWFFDSKD